LEKKKKKIAGRQKVVKKEQMASTVDEYQELMANEVYVEIDKLQDIAKHGIPDEVRGEVWKYLLGVQDPDKCMCFSFSFSFCLFVLFTINL